MATSSDSLDEAFLRSLANHKARLTIILVSKLQIRTLVGQDKKTSLAPRRDTDVISVNDFTFANIYSLLEYTAKKLVSFPPPSSLAQR